MGIVAQSFKSSYTEYVLGGADSPWTPDFSLGANFHITLNGMIDISMPINAQVGQTGLFEVLMNHADAAFYFSGDYSVNDFEAILPDLSLGRTNVVQYRVLQAVDTNLIHRVLITPIAFAAVNSGS